MCKLISGRIIRRHATPPKNSAPEKFAIAGARSPAREARALPRSRAFTLIELLVVIAIIAILVGLLFPAFKAVQNQARQTQAKNDLTQIVNAVNAFYTEYGKYPLGHVPIRPTDLAATTNDAVTSMCYAAMDATNNPRQIVFISPPDVKNSASPRSGIGTWRGRRKPWAIFRSLGNNYVIRIDGNYNNQLTNPYSANAGATPLNIGVIAWSLGCRSEPVARATRMLAPPIRRRDFVAVIAGRGRHGAATTALLTDSLNFLRRSVHHEKRRSSAAVQNVAATLHAICCFAFWSAPVLRRFWSSAVLSAVLSGEHGQADALRTAHATAFGRKRPIGTGNLFRLQSATENLKSKISLRV